MQLLVDADLQEGEWLDANGYIRVGDDEYVHRRVAEAALGKPLPKGAIVHHVDGNKADNAPTNLVICQDQKYHLLLHARQRILELGGHPDTDAFCTHHKCLHSKEEFAPVARRWNGVHNMCRKGTNEMRKINDLNRSRWNWKLRMHQQTRRAIRAGRCSPCVS